MGKGESHLAHFISHKDIFRLPSLPVYPSCSMKGLNPSIHTHFFGTTVNWKMIVYLKKSKWAIAVSLLEEIKEYYGKNTPTEQANGRLRMVRAMSAVLFQITDRAPLLLIMHSRYVESLLSIDKENGQTPFFFNNTIPPKKPIKHCQNNVLDRHKSSLGFFPSSVHTHKKVSLDKKPDSISFSRDRR